MIKKVVIYDGPFSYELIPGWSEHFFIVQQIEAIKMGYAEMPEEHSDKKK